MKTNGFHPQHSSFQDDRRVLLDLGRYIGYPIFNTKYQAALSQQGAAAAVAKLLIEDRMAASSSSSSSSMGASSLSSSSTSPVITAQESGGSKQVSVTRRVIKAIGHMTFKSKAISLLGELCFLMDHIHDAFDKRCSLNGALKGPEPPKLVAAKEVYWLQFQELFDRFAAWFQEERGKKSQLDSRDIRAVNSFRFLQLELQQATSGGRDTKNLKDSKMKDIMTRLLKQRFSLLKMVSYCSFSRRDPLTGVTERGLVVSLDYEWHAGVIVTEWLPRHETGKWSGAASPNDRGASDTILGQMAFPRLAIELRSLEQEVAKTAYDGDHPQAAVVSTFYDRNGKEIQRPRDASFALERISPISVGQPILQKDKNYDQLVDDVANLSGAKEQVEFIRKWSGGGMRDDPRRRRAKTVEVIEKAHAKLKEIEDVGGSKVDSKKLRFPTDFFTHIGSDRSHTTAESCYGVMLDPVTMRLGMEESFTGLDAQTSAQKDQNKGTKLLPSTAVIGDALVIVVQGGGVTEPTTTKADGAAAMHRNGVVTLESIAAENSSQLLQLHLEAGSSGGAGAPLPASSTCGNSACLIAATGEFSPSISYHNTSVANEPTNFVTQFDIRGVVKPPMPADPLALIAKSLEELDSFEKKRCGYANAVGRGTPSIPPDACVCQLKEPQKVADCVQGHLTQKQDGTYRVPTSEESSESRKQGYNWCPCWASYINNPLSMVADKSLAFWSDPFKLVTLLGIGEEELAGYWGKKGVGAAYDEEQPEDLYDPNGIKSPLVSLRRTATIKQCKVEWGAGWAKPANAEAVKTQCKRRGKALLLEAAKVSKGTRQNRQHIDQLRRKAAILESCSLPYEQGLHEFLDGQIGTAPSYASIGSARANQEQSHFPASGAGNSGENPLVPTAAHGLAMCSVHCHCKGLCTGNMEMAAYGFQIALLWKKARDKVNELIEEAEDEDGMSDRSLPQLRELRELRGTLENPLRLYELESTRVPIFALAQVVIAGTEQGVEGSLGRILTEWESNLTDATGWEAEGGEKHVPNLQSVVLNILAPAAAELLVGDTTDQDQRRQVDKVTVWQAQKAQALADLKVEKNLGSKGDGMVELKIHGLKEPIDVVGHLVTTGDDGKSYINVGKVINVGIRDASREDDEMTSDEITVATATDKYELEDLIALARSDQPSTVLTQGAKKHITDPAVGLVRAKDTPANQITTAVESLSRSLREKTKDLRADSAGKVSTSMKIRYDIPFAGLSHGNKPPSGTGELEWYIMNRILVDVGLSDPQAWAVLNESLPGGLNYVASVGIVSAGTLAATVLAIDKWDGVITSKEQLAIAQKVYTTMGLGNPTKLALEDDAAAYEDAYEYDADDFDPEDTEEALWLLGHRIQKKADEAGGGRPRNMYNEFEALKRKKKGKKGKKGKKAIPSSIIYAKNALIKLADFLKGAQDALQFQAAKSMNHTAFMTGIPCTTAVTSSDKMGVLGHAFTSVEVDQRLGVQSADRRTIQQRLDQLGLARIRASEIFTELRGGFTCPFLPTWDCSKYHGMSPTANLGTQGSGGWTKPTTQSRAAVVLPYAPGTTITRSPQQVAYDSAHVLCDDAMRQGNLRHFALVENGRTWRISPTDVADWRRHEIAFFTGKKVGMTKFFVDPEDKRLSVELDNNKQHRNYKKWLRMAQSGIASLEIKRLHWLKGELRKVGLPLDRNRGTRSIQLARFKALIRCMEWDETDVALTSMLSLLEPTGPAAITATSSSSSSSSQSNMAANLAKKARWVSKYTQHINSGGDIGDGSIAQKRAEEIKKYIKENKGKGDSVFQTLLDKAQEATTAMELALTTALGKHTQEPTMPPPSPPSASASAPPPPMTPAQLALVREPAPKRKAPGGIGQFGSPHDSPTLQNRIDILMNSLHEIRKDQQAIRKESAAIRRAGWLDSDQSRLENMREEMVANNERMTRWQQQLEAARKQLRHKKRNRTKLRNPQKGQTLTSMTDSGHQGGRRSRKIRRKRGRHSRRRKNRRYNNRSYKLKKGRGKHTRKGR